MRDTESAALSYWERRRPARRGVKQGGQGRKVGRRTRRARVADKALYTTVRGESIPSCPHPVLHARKPELAPLHRAGVRRLKLTKSSRQDALRITRIGRRESTKEQYLSSGCAKVSWSEHWVKRRCVVGEQSGGQRHFDGSPYLNRHLQTSICP